jgi:TonB family protein
MNTRLVTSLLLAEMLVSGVLFPLQRNGFQGQEPAGRKLKFSVPPEYPELARKMNLKGVAQVELTVASDGTVKEVKEIGGNPIFLQALVQAVKRWKYEPSGRESLINVKFEFGQ